MPLLALFSSLRPWYTHGHSIRVFPSDLLALGLPLLERMLLFVLELHCPRWLGDCDASELLSRCRSYYARLTSAFGDVLLARPFLRRLLLPVAANSFVRLQIG